MPSLFKTIVLLTLSFNASAGVFFSDNALVYEGEINHQNNQLAQSVIDQHGPAITEIRITSGGGNIDHGMDLADIVLANNLNVVVPTFCFSSCANYVFVAGKNKTLLPGALIGWHGDAASARWRDADIDAMVEDLEGEQRDSQWKQYRAHYDKVIENASAREKTLYDRLNINREIMTVGLHGQVKDAAIKMRARGWTFSINALKTFNINGLEGSEKWEPGFNQRFPLVIISSLQ